MRARLLDRLQTEADLRGALARDEFDLHYQPIVRLPDGSIAALEGLVRWRHPTRGLLPPGVFISIAEETGAIVDLGRFVIARACADAARWNATRPGKPPILVTVNLSPVQLGDVGLPEFIATSLAASGIKPHQLGLEITETVVFSDNPEHATRLLEIRRLGVQLLLDDYGTGYSSLSYIRRFPLDYLKLDRQFVSGIGVDDTDTAIIVAICDLARALGLIVVAEGVESASSWPRWWPSAASTPRATTSHGRSPAQRSTACSPPSRRGTSTVAAPMLRPGCLTYGSAVRQRKLVEAGFAAWAARARASASGAVAPLARAARGARPSAPRRGRGAPGRWRR